MLGDGDKVTIGTPRVEGAAVSATVVRQTRGQIIIFRRKRRKNHRRTQGHRQDLTLLVNAIAENGKALALKAAPKGSCKDRSEGGSQSSSKKGSCKKEAIAKKAPAKAAAKKATAKAAAKSNLIRRRRADS